MGEKIKQGVDYKRTFFLLCFFLTKRIKVNIITREISHKSWENASMLFFFFCIVYKLPSIWATILNGARIVLVFVFLNVCFLSFFFLLFYSENKREKIFMNRQQIRTGLAFGEREN